MQSYILFFIFVSFFGSKFMQGFEVTGNMEFVGKVFGRGCLAVGEM